MKSLVQYRIVIACGLVAAIGTGIIGWKLLTAPVTSKVSYNTHSDREGTIISVGTEQAFENIDNATAVNFPVVRPKELLALEGTIPAPIESEPPLISVDMFVKTNGTTRDVIANSANLMVDPADNRTYRVMIEAPIEPGVYRVRLKWGFNHYLGTGDLVVR
jgi:hypothetical protein